MQCKKLSLGRRVCAGLMLCLTVLVFGPIQAADWQPLTEQEMAKYHFTHRMVVSYTDITNQTSATAFNIFPVLGGTATSPRGTVVRHCAVKATTLLVAASMTACTIVIGDGAATNRYLLSSSVGGTGTSTVAGDWLVAPTNSATIQWGYVFGTAATNVQMTVTATGAALSALSAGSFEILLDVADLNKLGNN